MNRILALVVIVLMCVFISGCKSFGPGEGFPVNPTNYPGIGTNDPGVVEDWYDVDLTPGRDGSELTE